MNRIWRGSLLVTLLVSVATFTYVYAFYGKMGDYQLLLTVGVAAVLVIAPSLAFLGITYFFPRTKKLICCGPWCGCTVSINAAYFESTGLRLLGGAWVRRGLP